MFFRKRQDQRMEDRLRGLSAEPRDDFVRSLATEVRSSRVRTAMRSRRVLAAVVTTGLMLIPFAAFGGVGYASQAAKSAAQSVSGGNKGNDNAGSNNKGNGNTPDEDQYKPGKGCGDKNHEHERENECKKPPK